MITLHSFALMSPSTILLAILAYFGLLLFISFRTGKGADNKSFYLANKNAPWFVVAFGMIGASLSGVTFISVPGWVGTSSFSYMQMVLGYLLGYTVIATVLLPLYYRLNLTSIYSYLEDRFGSHSYKTGAVFFLISRTIGSAFRLYLVTLVLQLTIFERWGVPFAATAVLTLLLILLYTFKGGLKTIIWTDMLQTAFMLLAVVFSVYLIGSELGLSIGGMIDVVSDSKYSQTFFWDIHDKKHFLKQFFSGAFIAIVMTGLDQDMMQKNLSCRNLKDAQVNMFSFSIVLVFVNLLFLALGALLYIFAESKGITLPARSDEIYPMLATQGYLHPLAGFLFIIGLIAAAYSSADSALTALTTSFCVDILDIERKDVKNRIGLRKRVHISMAIIMVAVILVFKAVNDQSVISAIFTVAGYTYGPLLGLYAFGLFTGFKVKDRWVPYICVASPIICYLLNIFSDTLLGGYKFGFELLILNGFITFMGMMMLIRRTEKIK